MSTKFCPLSSLNGEQVVASTVPAEASPILHQLRTVRLREESRHAPLRAGWASAWLKCGHRKTKQRISL